MYLETAKKNNFYIEKNSFFYLHPVLKEIIKLDGDTAKINTRFTRYKLGYYLKKYLLLKKNGYFKKNYYTKNIKYRLDTFEKSIINCRQLIFEITEDCNLNCMYCGYGDLYINKNNRNNCTLPVDKAIALIDFMEKKWNKEDNNRLNKEININFYGGEPLLNFSFIKKIVEYTKTINLKYNNFTYGMTTNGVLLKKYMEYFKENNFILALSLDGNKKNNSLRVFKDGKSSYNIVVNNIISLKNKYPKYFEEKVSFLSVLHRHNSIEEIYTYFKKFNKVSSFLPLSLEGIKKSQSKNFIKLFVDVENNICNENAQNIIKENPNFMPPIGEKTKRYLFCTQDNFIKSKTDLLKNKHKVNVNATGTCIPLSIKIFLNAKGEIYPCEKALCMNPIGKIHNNIVKIDFKKINEKINYFLAKLSDQCSNCNISSNCSTCILTMEFEDSNYKCSSFKNDSEYKNNILDIIEYLNRNPELYEIYATKLI